MIKIKLIIINFMIKPIAYIGTYIFKIWGTILIFLLNHPILSILILIILIVLFLLKNKKLDNI